MGNFERVCELNDPLSPCGHPETGPFKTSGWDTQEQADLRMEEHYKEHETGEPMRELIEFEQAVGFKREVAE